MAPLGVGDEFGGRGRLPRLGVRGTSVSTATGCGRGASNPSSSVPTLALENFVFNRFSSKRISRFEDA